MLERILGVLVGALIVPLFLAGGPFVLDLVDVREALRIARVCAPIGALLGAWRPRLFLHFLLPGPESDT